MKQKCQIRSNISNVYVIEAYSRPNGKVLSVTPSYAMYDVYCEMYGRQSVHVHYDENLEMDVSDIIDAISDDIDLVIVLNPNNPVGDVYTYEEMDKIVEALLNIRSVSSNITMKSKKGDMMK